MPVENDVDSTRYFYGVNLDMQGLAQSWSGDAFYVYQTVDGIADRRAVGGELRYFDPALLLYGLLDYDTSYKTLTRWQIGADFRLVNVGALPAIDDILTTPATGNIYSYSAQLIGNNLYSKRDINVFNFTYQTSPTFRGEYFAYSNVTALNGAWTLQPTLRFYNQRDNVGVRLQRLTPGIQLSYRVRDNVTLESE